MDSDFLKRKLTELSNEKLVEVCDTAKPGSEIFDLAQAEAKRRNVTAASTFVVPNSGDFERDMNSDRLKEWNWGAFFFGPIWSLANKLDWWAILLFIPGINILALFYLGLYGNRLAYAKGSLKSVEDFMLLQQTWEHWAVRFIWLGLITGLLFLILEAVYL